jgi:carboxymethylenebutenolidase
VGKDIKLKASDGFQLGGYRADPAGTPKGAIVVIQEIFGVNHHIRAVCDRLAGAGYVAVRDVGPVGIIGFCLGGSIAYAAATKLSGLSAAVGYYGGVIVRFADDKPKVPTQLHFGEKDHGIPLTDVETIKAKRPDVEVFVYPGAEHGFNCDERASYNKASADIAWPRSLDFFAKHLKK